MDDGNNQLQDEKCPVLAERKKWEAGTQLLIPLVQLTMEESLSATEGKRAWVAFPLAYKQLYYQWPLLVFLCFVYFSLAFQIFKGAWILKSYNLYIPNSIYCFKQDPPKSLSSFPVVALIPGNSVAQLELNKVQTSNSLVAKLWISNSPVWLQVDFFSASQKVFETLNFAGTLTQFAEENF